MSSSCCCEINTCIKKLNFFIEFGAFICVCIIVSLSSSNPFKEHIIGNITIYYNSFGDDADSFSGNSIYRHIPLNETLTSEEIYNDILSYDNISKDIIKTSSRLYNFKKLFKRKIESDSFCTDIHESFIRNNGKKLSHIFDLNYETIYGLCLALLLVMLAREALTIILIILICKDKYQKVAFIILGIIAILLWIAKFVLFIILFHYIENGDIEKYDDFLDCKNVRTEYFKNFTDVDKLRKCFIAFTVLNLLADIFDKVEKLFEPCGQQNLKIYPIVPSSANNSTATIQQNN